MKTLKTLKELKIYMTECGYVCNELSEDQMRYFIDTHRVCNEKKYEGGVCKFTGQVYGLFDYVCDQHMGYVTEYKTSSGRKVFDQHRL